MKDHQEKKRSSETTDPPSSPSLVGDKEVGYFGEVGILSIVLSMSGYRTGAIVGATLAEWQTAEMSEDGQAFSWFTMANKTLGTYGAALVVVTKTVQEALTYFVQHLRHLIVTELPKNGYDVFGRRVPVSNAAFAGPAATAGAIVGRTGRPAQRAQRTWACQPDLGGHLGARAGSLLGRRDGSAVASGCTGPSRCTGRPRCRVLPPLRATSEWGRFGTLRGTSIVFLDIFEAFRLCGQYRIGALRCTSSSPSPPSTHPSLSPSRRAAAAYLALARNKHRRVQLAATQQLQLPTGDRERWRPEQGRKPELEPEPEPEPETDPGPELGRKPETELGQESEQAQVPEPEPEPVLGAD
ncbi:hypothetical protein FJT64_025989 [Amphibalanus amphitrite]|uniref:Uncharacterized protein n=1 Tax=Amphibalanus amphitrite TaxID=1232801 RepID=A0A6A4WIQ9_AMPAM|nr:hypothetical protein FJT64_025989 [Amphibalanus amphitrite]